MNNNILYTENGIKILANILPLIFLLICIYAAYSKKNNALNPWSKLIQKNRQVIGKQIFKDTLKGQYLFLFLYLGIALFVLLAFFNVRYEPYIMGIKDEMDVFMEAAFGITTIVITMAVVLISVDKEYYLIFSVRDILLSKHIYHTLYLLFSGCIVAAIITLTLLDGIIITTFDVVRFMILEMAIVTILCTAIYAFYIMMRIMFSTENWELRLLDQLYYFFEMNNIDGSRIKNKEKWNKLNMKLHVEALVDRYLKKSKCILKDNVTYIEFVTFWSKGNDEAYKSFRNSGLIWVLFFSLSYSFTNYVLIQNTKSVSWNIMNGIVLLIFIMFLLLPIRWLKNMVISLWGNDWGFFYVRKDGKKGIIRCPECKIGLDFKYDKYIKSLYNLMAFFKLACFLDIESNILVYGVELFNKYLQVESVGENNKGSQFIRAIPLFIIGFFLFKKGHKVKTVYDVYQSYREENLDSKKIQKMLFSMVVDFDKENLKEKPCMPSELKEYFLWLEN